MGFGDVDGLAEKLNTVIDEKKAKELTKKIKKGAFNFNDFLDQMEQMKKLGSMKSIMGMLPGMGGMADKLKNMDLENSGEIKRIKSLISSMTLKEREKPDLINLSRKRRMAKGCGLSEVQINKILKQFKNAAKMAKKMAGKGGMKDMQKMMAQMGNQGQIPR
jgi:signal recognition particle subunit SRP54